MTIETRNAPHVAILLRNLIGGGAERVLLNLANGLIEKGIAVSLVLMKAEGDYLESFSKSGKLVDLNAKKFDKNLKLITSFQSLTSLPKLIKYLRQEKPLILFSATHYCNEIAILAKYMAGVCTRVVVSEHTHLSVEAQRVEQASARLAPLTSRCLYPWADGIVTVSHGVAQDLSHLTGISLERINVIYNAAISSDLETKSQEVVEHPWFISGQPPVILGCGRLVAQKDFPTLIRAFALVRKVRPARLMILGKGREQPKLEALVRELGLEEETSWMGFVNNPFAYMKKCAVFVLSSAWEGLPTVLIEAMAVGLPVVATDCPSGPREILRNGEYGELVPVGDSQAMAEAILRVLSGKVKLTNLAWLEQFTLQGAIQRYLDVLGLASS